ncbi:MAG TPA: DJ-1/PfpI family protein, partial [Dehalococcoidia bacterium]
DLDAIGPKEVFGMLAMGSNGDWRVVIVSQDGGPVRSYLGTTIEANHSFSDCPRLDVLLVPGGLGTRTEVDNDAIVGFIREQGRGAEWVTSVCTGAFLLHRAGFLEGKRATTHWGAIELLKQEGNVTVVDDERWVQDGNVITAAGVSAGIDMALYLVAELTSGDTAKLVRQMMEYYPKPPEFAEEAPA